MLLDGSRLGVASTIDILQECGQEPSLVKAVDWLCTVVACHLHLYVVILVKINALVDARLKQRVFITQLWWHIVFTRLLTYKNKQKGQFYSLLLSYNSLLIY